LPSPAKRKLSYKESRELEELPGRIDALEARIAALGAAMQAPGFYQQESARIVAHNNELSALQLELDAAYARWTELDA
jgi:ATP-binding cassette subfamily F protein uup